MATGAGLPRYIFLRSVLTSLFTTALDFGTLVGLTELAHVNYVLSTWIGSIAGSLANFTINKQWAFSAFGRFLIVQAGSSGLNTLGVWLFTRFGHLPYPASKAIVAMLVYLAWNYPLNRWFVFPRSAPTRPPTSETITEPSRE
jgi:putative flippase GtrA